MAEPGWGLLVAGLALLDMNANYCEAGCLAPREAVPRLSISAGPIVYREDVSGGEIYVRRDTSAAFGPLGLGYGVSVATGGAVWAGAGVVHTFEIPGTQAYFQSHFMPGIYIRGNGVDIGGSVNARAGFELGLETDRGIRVGLSVNHRSNGGLYRDNPGVDTVQVRVAFPFR